MIEIEKKLHTRWILNNPVLTVDSILPFDSDGILLNSIKSDPVALRCFKHFAGGN